jgi:hypothetical protein
LHLAPQEQGHRKAHCIEGGFAGLITLEVKTVGGFVRGQGLIDFTRPPGRISQGRMIVRGELSVLLSEVERVPRAGPVAPTERFSSRF